MLPNELNVGWKDDILVSYRYTKPSVELVTKSTPLYESIIANEIADSVDIVEVLLSVS